MIKIEGNEVNLNKTMKLKPKHAAILKSLPEYEAQKYLMSLLGMFRGQIYQAKANRNALKSYGLDKLSEKNKDTVLTEYTRLLNTNREHRPMNKDLGEWIGVEVECLIPKDGYDCYGQCGCGDPECGDNNGDGSSGYDDARSDLKHAINKAKIARCTVKDDGSVSDDDGIPVEVTLLFNSKHGFEPLEKLCTVLKKMGCYVNDSCGLHVHLDYRHMPKRNVTTIGKRLTNALPILSHMVPKDRRNNTYCQLSMSKYKGNRYHAVNMTAFEKFKTIEIRLHSGTTNFVKIKNWIDILKYTAISPISIGDEWQDFLDKTSMPDRLVEYILERVKKFEDGADEESEAA